MSKLVCAICCVTAGITFIHEAAVTERSREQNAIEIARLQLLFGRGAEAPPTFRRPQRPSVEIVPDDRGLRL